MKKTLKNNKGITLLALVITIIILLILASIVLRSLENKGVIGKAKEAKTKHKESITQDNTMLKEYEDVLETAEEDDVIDLSGTYYCGNNNEISLTLTKDQVVVTSISGSGEEEKETYTYRLDGTSIYATKSESESEPEPERYMGTYTILSNGTKVIFYLGSGTVVFSTGEIVSRNDVSIAGTFKGSWKQEHYDSSNGELKGITEITARVTFTEGSNIITLSRSETGYDTGSETTNEGSTIYKIIGDKIMLYERREIAEGEYEESILDISFEYTCDSNKNIISLKTVVDWDDNDEKPIFAVFTKE